MHNDLEKIKKLFTPTLLFGLIVCNSAFLISENGQLMNGMIPGSLYRGFFFAGLLEVGAFTLAMFRYRNPAEFMLRIMAILTIAGVMIVGAALFGQSTIIETSVIAENDLLKLSNINADIVSVESDISGLEILHSKNLKASQKGNAGMNNQNLTSMFGVKKRLYEQKTDLLKNMTVDTKKDRLKSLSLSYILICRAILQIVNLILFFGFHGIISRRFNDLTPDVKNLTPDVKHLTSTESDTYKNHSDIQNGNLTTDVKNLTTSNTQCQNITSDVKHLTSSNIQCHNDLPNELHDAERVLDLIRISKNGKKSFKQINASRFLGSKDKTEPIIVHLLKVGDIICENANRKLWDRIYTTPAGFKENLTGNVKHLTRIK